MTAFFHEDSDEIEDAIRGDTDEIDGIDHGSKPSVDDRKYRRRAK